MFDLFACFIWYGFFRGDGRQRRAVRLKGADLDLHMLVQPVVTQYLRGNIRTEVAQRNEGFSALQRG